MRPKIFVSVSVLGWDTELTTTVLSCLQNRSGDNDVTIGIAFIGNLGEWDEARHDLLVFEDPETSKMVKMKRFRLKDNWGVSRGRNLAASLYSGEDYFLQVDAHTYFANNWDKTLVQKYKEATTITKNKRTVLTAIPLEYVHPNNGANEIYLAEKNIGYPAFSEGRWWINGAVPGWNHVDPSGMYSRALKAIVTKTGFAPSPKTCAAFMFGGKELGKNILLPDNLVFWEEEIVQSVELLSLGFSFVYPLMVGPIYHMYGEWTTPTHGARFNVGELFSMYKDLDDRLEGMDTKEFNPVDHLGRINFNNYYEKNFEKIVAYEKYAHVSLRSAIVRRKYPDGYANIGFDPVEGGTK
jgi:hypothetical protein